MSDPATARPRARDWDAATYDRVADPQAQWGSRMLEHLPLQGDETVIDAGCGTGRVTELLAKRLPRGRVVAVDLSPSMLAEARRRLAPMAGRLRFVESDLLDLSAATLGDAAPVDAMFSTATFHWITDHDRLFSNLAGVLRPGGRLVAQCGAKGNVARFIEAVRRAGYERGGNWLYASAEETRGRLTAAGFEDVEVWTHPEPTRFEDRQELEAFIATVCLRAHLADMAPEDRAEAVRAVADAMDEPVIDYVRLNIVARRR